jgi:riboflavin kinase/FMN adenylyltransferase
MEVLHGPELATPLDRPSVVTLGVFDGIHRGHAVVIGRAVRAARDHDALAVAVTFEPHPTVVLSPSNVPPLITTPERKADLIGALGVDVLAVMRFDRAFASWPAERFARRILADDLRAIRVVVGENFTFGHRALGTPAVLTELGGRLGFGADAVPLVELRGRTISSSSIRDAVAAGELAWPSEALGRPFAVDGRIVAGAGRGAGMGYPTANLDVASGMLLPGRGIYAGRLRLGRRSYGAAISVGTNPTFGVEPLHVEAFLLDFDGDLRGRDVSVEFVERLRDEERFDAVDALVRRMDEDVERTRAILGTGLPDAGGRVGRVGG